MWHGHWRKAATREVRNATYVECEAIRPSADPTARAICTPTDRFLQKMNRPPPPV